MAHFANDVHHRLSTRIRDIIPDFIESEYPAFVSFVNAYYEFLEQYDNQPVASTYTLQPGVITVRSGNSTILGGNTQFSNTAIYANNVQFRVGSDQFRIRSVANSTNLVIYEVPARSYFANTHTVETNKSVRQASGAIRQLLTIHDVEHTLDDFVTYFRDTYLRDIPQGLTDTTVLIPRILDFYKSRGSEASYQFLFRSLYGKEATFSYPRESVFTTSDNQWVKPIILRLDHEADLKLDSPASSFNSSQTVFSLTTGGRAVFPATARNLTISINGVIQEPDTAYTVSGSTITFTNAPTTGQTLVGVLKSTTGNVSSIETREIIGLSSNAHATVLQAVHAFEGARQVVRLFIDEPTIIQELGELLLEDGTGALLVTKFGVPPEGLASEIYSHTLVQEFIKTTTFQAGEVISTTPINDPDAITGRLVGSITGFIINQRGAGYKENDLIYPPARSATGALITGGFGAVGKISAFTDVDLTEVNIDNVGLGYYKGLPLIVDNTGTGGGFGLSGHISAVSPGNILINYQGSPSDGDILTFTHTDGINYQSSREKIDYYEVGVSLADLFGGLLLEGEGNTGSDLQDEQSGRQLLAEDAITLNTAVSNGEIMGSWSTSNTSAIFGANLQTTIIGLTSNLSVHPVFINGVRTEVGEVFSVTVDSFGEGYVAGLPTIAVQTPTIPTADADGLEPLTYQEIFGDAFRAAILTVEKETGQIGQVDVVTGGSGYSNVAFSVNSSTSTTTTGHDAELSMTLGAISFGEPYFRNTRSFVSADQYLQDVTKYQPFSYVMTVEEDLSRYAAVVKRLLHPAGGLLLPRQTITTEVDLASVITFGGMDLTFQIEEDLFSTPQSIKTITITAPPATIALVLPVGASPSVSAIFDIQAPGVTLHLTMPVSTAAITLTTGEEATHLVIPVGPASISITAPEETTFFVVPVETNTLTSSAPTVVIHLFAPVGTNTISVAAPTVAVAPQLSVLVETNTITMTAVEETEQLAIPVDTATINSSAPTVTEHLIIPITTNTITLTAAEETEHLAIPMSTVTINSSVSSVTLHQGILVSTNTITLTAAEEIEHIAGNIVTPVNTNTVTMTAAEETIASTLSISVETNTLTSSAPTVVIHLFVPVTYDTLIGQYAGQQISGQETNPILGLVNWESNRIDVTAPTATV